MGTRTYSLLLLFTLLCAGLILPCPPQAFPAAIDPSFRFSTIETEHFSIHFHQGEDELANRAASVSENVHGRLSETFLWSPAEKTQIVLIDSTDFANGFANVLPYNVIYIYAAPPLPDSPLSEYDDWLEYIILHEYTHILTMDPSSGHSAVTRSVFGKPLPGADPLSSLLFLAAAPPNVFMPDWWLEGVATWAESEYTGAGRGKSAYVEMIFRMAVQEDAIPGVDRINGDVPFWPARSIPYIYGMLVEKHIAQKYGEDRIGELNKAHSGRFPFFISGPPGRLLGKDYARLYRDAVRELKDDQDKKIRQLKARPLTEYTRLEIEGERTTNPRLSPDGRYLAVNRKDPHRHEEIAVIDRVTLKEVYTVRKLPSDSGLSWSHDSRKIYFTQADLVNTYNLYQDIYSYDLSERSVKRITKGLRAKDIDVSPDGRRIVFVKVETGRQNIAVMDTEGGSERTLSGFRDAVLSSPGWSPDGRLVVFSMRDNSGLTSVGLLDAGTNSVETLLMDGHNNVSPTWSPDGDFIIFASDRTGVFNLFAYSLSRKKLYQITHVLGGTFHPEVSPDGKKILFTGYSSKGFYAAEMPFDASGWSETSGPRIDITWDSGKKDGAGAPAAAAGASGKKPYCPASTLAPRFWMPALSFDDDGAVIGAFTAAQDALGYHTYALQGGYGTGSDRTYFNLNYVYDRWYPTFSLRWYSLPVFYPEFFEDGDNFYERRSGFTAQVSLPVYKTLESRLSLVAGYNPESLKHLTGIEGRTVEDHPVFEGKRGNVFAGLEFANALKYPYSISREEGRSISFLYKNYSEAAGSDLSRQEYLLDYNEYIGTGTHQVVYLNARAAASGGDVIAQQAFRLGGTPGNEYSLRGFPSGFRTGEHIARASVEYRFPVKYIFSGWSTKPFFFDRLHVAAFADAGNVWGRGKGSDGEDISAGVGAEARLDMVLGYKLKLTPALGLARGLTEDGDTQVYLTVYTGL
ncbi:MAG: PD40 domain-containing protein [Nitrospirae bacterium]|nr:PD40 domain-containing protein [Nitrospirota bacterium]